MTANLKLIAFGFVSRSGQSHKREKKSRHRFKIQYFFGHVEKHKFEVVEDFISSCHYGDLESVSTGLRLELTVGIFRTPSWSICAGFPSG
jgi:hypothetical protein